MSAAQYDLLNLSTNGEYAKEFILRTPKTRQVYPSYEAAKAAFNGMRKAKEWILFHSVNGELTVYVNHEVANKTCIVTNKI